ncbi:MAG: hypothetical protein ACE366_17810 [Bradymonadia bacterium]
MASQWSRRRLASLTLSAALAVSLSACDTSSDSCDGGPCPEDGAAGSAAHDMGMGGAPEGGMGGELEGGAGGEPMGGLPEGGAGGEMGGEGGGGRGGEGGAGGDEGGAGGGGPTASHPIQVRVGGTDVDSGGGYFHPMNAGNARTPLFSFYGDIYTVANESDAPVNIDDIHIEYPEGIQPEEFTIRNCLNDNDEQIIAGATIAPGESVDFDLCFYSVGGDLPPFEGEEYACQEDRDCGCFADDMDCPPIRYRGEYCLEGVCQAPRQADVVITYDDGETYRFTASGRARPRATTMFSHGQSQWEMALGGMDTDELMGGMVADAEGNLIFTANVTQVINNFAHDIVVGKVDASGRLAWLKAWSGKFQDYSRDPGQNAETGGGAGSIAIDGAGDVYVVGSHSATSSNSLFWSLVIKLDGETGEVLWQKTWGNTSGPRIARDGNEAYGVDVTEDHVLVTGVDEDNAKVLFLGLDPQDGSVKFQRNIEVAAGSNDRGYAIKADGRDGAFIGGLTNGRGLLMYVTGIRENRPSLRWARRVNMGVGSNINHIDVDDAGNAYLSLDRRGANTSFSVMQVDRDGNFRWGRSFHPTGAGDKDNTHVVQVVGDQLYIGGRVGVSEYDAQFGDGLLVRANKDTGELTWATFYYTGKGAEEMGEHRVKGVAVGPEGELLVAGQAYTNPNNHFRYHGYWYDATRKPGDAEDDRPFDWSTYCPDGDAACAADCGPGDACTFGFELIPEATLNMPEGNRGLVNADEAAAQDRNFNMVPSFNGIFDLSGAPLEGTEGVEGTGAMPLDTLEGNEGNGPDGEIFLMKLTVD